MRGDVLVIQPWHTSAGRKAAELITSEISSKEGRFAVTVAGESGSGKSEIAEVISEALAEQGLKCIILQQDDYFVYPPKTNENVRRRDPGWVGIGEVKLDLLDQNIADIKAGETEIRKPLVIFEEDRVTEETISIDEAVKVVIAEGTFTTTLKNADLHIFIDLDYTETKKARLERAREEQDDFLENVLQIEHEIISAHKPMAHIIVTGDYEVVKNV
ncbi:MAG: zeta toxin family protein [Dehalococcoidia bacterium]